MYDVLVCDVLCDVFTSSDVKDPSTPIVIRVYDKDYPVGKDFLGECTVYPLDITSSKSNQWIILTDKFELKEDGIVIKEEVNTKETTSPMTDKDLKKTVTGAIQIGCEFKWSDENNALSLKNIQPGLKIWRGSLFSLV